MGESTAVTVQDYDLTIALEEWGATPEQVDAVFALLSGRYRTPATLVPPKGDGFVIVELPDDSVLQGDADVELAEGDWAIFRNGVLVEAIRREWLPVLAEKFRDQPPEGAVRDDYETYECLRWWVDTYDPEQIESFDAWVARERAATDRGENDGAAGDTAQYEVEMESGMDTAGHLTGSRR